MKKISVLLFIMTTLIVGAFSQSTARLQIIHNSPSPTVDIYFDANLQYDNVQFRQATAFADVPAGVAVNVGIAPENSASAADAIANFVLTFEAGKTYVAVASGIVGGTPAFNLIATDAARETASVAGKVDIAVFHGSPDAPAVDVDAVFLADNVVDNLAYGNFTGYLSLDPGKYDLAVRANDDPNVVASFRADLSGLGGGAATVFASGLLGGTPAFGLYAALPNGTVIALPLTPTARVQIIHNSPDPTVDVYVGNTRLADDFAFRTATPFINVPSDRDLNVGVALSSSTSAGDAIANFPVNFETGKTYVVAASGIVGGTPGFTLLVNNAARETASVAGKVDIAVLHGSPNAPAVDVDAVFLADNVVDNLAYGNFTGYLSLDPGKYDLAVRANDDPNVVASFRADLSGLGGGAATVFASGLLGGTPAFGLYAALPNGTVIALPLTPTARVQIIHNSPDPTVDVYVGNTRLADDFAFRTATPFINVPSDRDLNVGVALSTSTSAGDAIANFPVNFETGKTYVVAASGIVGGTPGFTLLVNNAARETASVAGKVDIAVLHGSPNAPAVDVDAVFLADNVVDNLAYGNFTGYLSLDPGKYDLAVRANDDPNVVASFRADLSGLGGGAATVFASGLLGGTPAFGLYAALPNGTVIALPLTPTARVQIIHNSPDPTVDVYVGNTRLADDFAFRTATPFINVPSDRDLNVGVALSTSTSAGDAIANFPVNFETGKTYVVFAAGVVGGTPGFNLFVNDQSRELSLDPALVDIQLFHGAPDAPAVDVKLPAGLVLFDNVSFGDFSPYQSVPPAEYIIQVTPANDNNSILKTYLAAIPSDIAGQAVTVFASGFFTAGQTPGFGVWVALGDGTTFPLPEIVSTNELNSNLSDLRVFPNPVQDAMQLRFQLAESTQMRYMVRDVQGKTILDGDFGLVPAGEFNADLRVDALSNGAYWMSLLTEKGIKTFKFMV